MNTELAPLLEATSSGFRWYVRRMSDDDVPRVSRIEAEAFPTMKPPTSFRRELKNNLARYVVACRLSEDGSTEEELMGYAGVWLIIDEAHLISIAVADAYRRQGVGQALLLVALEIAIERECIFMTLEVRESNAEARGMYEKFGFRRVGLRLGYYTDTKEDALLLTVDDIKEPEYLDKLAAIKAVLSGQSRN